MESEVGQKIDKHMAEKYKATPSSVCKDWLKSGSCWLKAYCHVPADKTAKPDLYMVHCVSHEYGETVIVYHSVEDYCL